MTERERQSDIDTVQQRLLSRALQPLPQQCGQRLRWQGLTLGSEPLDEHVDVEIAVIPHPLACTHGFMLFVGCTPLLRSAAKPLLDALAPLPDAWLWCGPRGSARFCRRVFDVFAYLNGPLLARSLPAGNTPPDWPAFFAEQLSLSASLLALAQQYRAACGDVCHLDAAALLQEFARPPMLHSHYALTLARMLELALSQQQTCQDLFNQLLQGTAVR